MCFLLFLKIAFSSKKIYKTAYQLGNVYLLCLKNSGNPIIVHHFNFPLTLVEILNKLLFYVFI